MLLNMQVGFTSERRRENKQCLLWILIKKKVKFSLLTTKPEKERADFFLLKKKNKIKN